jgi:hypothetical protein
MFVGADPSTSQSQHAAATNAAQAAMAQAAAAQAAATQAAAAQAAAQAAQAAQAAAAHAQAAGGYMSTACAPHQYVQLSQTPGVIHGQFKGATQPHVPSLPGAADAAAAAQMWNPYAQSMPGSLPGSLPGTMQQTLPQTMPHMMPGLLPPQGMPMQPYGLQGLSIPRTRGEREDASGRWVLEPEDVLLLERVFAIEKCPGRELRSQLSARLHVKPRQIQVWFQNKRQRTKNGAKPTVAEALAHAVYSNDMQTSQKEPAELLMTMAQSGTGAPAPTAPPPSADGVLPAADNSTNSSTSTLALTHAAAATPDDATTGDDSVHGGSNSSAASDTATIAAPTSAYSESEGVAAGTQPSSANPPPSPARPSLLTATPLADSSAAPPVPLAPVAANQGGAAFTAAPSMCQHPGLAGHGMPPATSGPMSVGGYPDGRFLYMMPQPQPMQYPGTAVMYAPQAPGVSATPASAFVGYAPAAAPVASGGALPGATMPMPAATPPLPPSTAPPSLNAPSAPTSGAAPSLPGVPLLRGQSSECVSAMLALSGVAAAACSAASSSMPSSESQQQVHPALAQALATENSNHAATMPIESSVSA